MIRIPRLARFGSVLAAALAVGCSESEVEAEPKETTQAGLNAASLPGLDGTFVGARLYEGGAASVQFDFEQRDGALRGSLDDSAFGRAPITGTVHSNRVEFASIHDEGNLIVEWWGQPDAERTRLDGTWRVVVGPPADGRWTASR